MATMTEIIIETCFPEEHGAGEVGTDELRKKYQKDTPNEAIGKLSSAARSLILNLYANFNKNRPNEQQEVDSKDFDAMSELEDQNLIKVVKEHPQVAYVLLNKNGQKWANANESIEEDVPASATTTADIPIVPMVKRKDAKQYDVNAELFRRFKQGRNKFERWSKYFDMTNEEEAAICNLIKSSKKQVILRNSETGAMISIRKRASNEG